MIVFLHCIFVRFSSLLPEYTLFFKKHNSTRPLISPSARSPPWRPSVKPGVSAPALAHGKQGRRGAGTSARGFRCLLLHKLSSSQNARPRPELQQPVISDASLLYLPISEGAHRKAPGPRGTGTAHADFLAGPVLRR